MWFLPFKVLLSKIDNSITDIKNDEFYGIYIRCLFKSWQTFKQKMSINNILEANVECIVEYLWKSHSGRIHEIIERGFLSSFLF